MKTTARCNDDVVKRLRSLEIDRTGSARPRRRYWFLAMAFLIFLAACAVAYVSWPRNSSNEPLTAVEKTDIAATAEPEAGAPPPSIASSDWLVAGYLVARRESLVSAEVTATVAALFVEAGTSVEAGEIIARLDDALAEADLRIAASRAEAAARTIEAIGAERAEAEKVLERIRVLAEASASSQASLDNAQARFGALTARFRQAQAEHQMMIEEAGRASAFIEKHTIKAPFTGVITGCDVEVGEAVSPMSANGSSGVGVCTIFDPLSIEIEIDVPETMISRIRLGSEAQAFLDAYPDDALPVAVSAIAPEANREKSTIQVRLTFTEPDPRLRPNMAVKVSL